MKKQIYIALIFLLQLPVFWGFAVRFDRISVRDGLSNGLVNCIVQDKKGFLWIATEDGLNRYDGYSFVIYRPQRNDTTSISSNICKVIYEDSEGFLWIGTVSGGLNRFDPHTETFTSFKYDPHNPSTLSDNNVYAIYEDKKKNLWIGTFGGGLNLFDRKSGRFIRYKHEISNLHSLAGNNIRSITENASGNLIIGIDEGGIDLFDPVTRVFSHLTKKNSKLSSNVLLSTFVDSYGRIWAGTWGGGVNLISGPDNTVQVFKNNPKSDNSLSSNENFAFAQDFQRRIWITTRAGLDCYDEQKKQFTHYRNDLSDESSLSDNLTTSLFIDRSGILWIGTWGSGICKLDLHAKGFNQLRSRLNDPNSLSSNNIFSLFEDEEGLIWVGTQNNGLDCFNPQTRRYRHFVNKHTDSRSLSCNVVRAICSAERGYLWIGTDGGGLNRLNKQTGECERFVASGKSTDISNNAIYCLRYEADSKVLWIGTYGGGLNRYDVKNKKFEHFSVNHFNQMKNVILSIARDNDGRLWVGTGGMGLLYFNEERKMFFSYKDFVNARQLISSQVINALLVDNNNNLWIGSSGAGLDRIDFSTKKITHFSSGRGLNNDMIVSLIPDFAHNIWIGTNNGVTEYDPFAEEFRSFTVADGLQDAVFNHNACVLSKSGQLYFGGINGINYWYPDSIKENKSLPSVALTDFRVFNQSVRPSKNGALSESITYTTDVILDHKSNVLTLEFAALHYVSPSKNKYAYKLDGFDSKWNYATADRRFVTYTNLPGGVYVFKVKASNSDGVWNNTPASLRITVIPPFWQTVYFYLFLAVLLIVILYISYRYRMRSFYRKREELEDKVTMRTEELHLQKQELIQINEQLNQQTEELKVQGDSLREINAVLSDQAKQLRFKSEMLLATNEEIKSKNKLVTESIRYAKRIQDSILPSSQQLDPHFQEYFILYKPRDIVSGDFYWFAQPAVDEWGRPVEAIVIAAVDCTGHGVPGAFMSIIGNTQLNQIVLNRGILKPGDILTALNNGIIDALSSQDSGGDFADDGMDISICTINFASGIVQCGAAMQKIYFVSQKNGLTVIEGDIFSIGELFSILKKPNFNTVSLEYEPGDMLYMFSDGITDQFGGKKREKYQESRFRELIASVASYPAHKQKEIIYQTFDEWKTNESQLDDVMVLGFRLK